jgi:hypothetical protein
MSGRDELALPRRDLLRRLRALFLAGGLSFALTTWLLVRIENPGGRLEPARPARLPADRQAGSGSEPASVARAHLEALNRGELRAAYGFFSAQYRQQVPFEAFHELVVTHPEMLRAREVWSTAREISRDHAVLESHLRLPDGARYLARFVMVHAAGRWWIDGLRWTREARKGGGIQV